MARPQEEGGESYGRALATLRSCLTGAGYVSAPVEKEKEALIWARDGIIAGLAGLASGETALINGMERTLDTLAAHQGPHGEIPQYVSADGKRISYGEIAGSVDALLWYVVGVCAHYGVTKHPSRQVRYWLTIERALNLAACWEYNTRGFIYTPMVEEYVQQGYILSNQLLYAAALRGAGSVFKNKDWQKKGAYLQSVLALNYWPQREMVDDARIYHLIAYRAQCEQEETQYWLPSFTPGGYTTRFDALAHALATLTGLGSVEQRRRADAAIDELAQQTGSLMLPTFWPIIQPGEPLWTVLEINHVASEQPSINLYNGTLWPALTGLYAMGLVQDGQKERAQGLLDVLTALNEQLPVMPAAQAVASILAHQAVRQGKSLWPLNPS